MVFFGNNKDIRLFAIVGILFTLFALSFLPVTQWQFFLEYFFVTPPIQIIGQGALYFLGIFVLTILIIFLREVARS